VTAQAAPWAAAEPDVDRALAELRRWFPTATLWRGPFTRNWFALVRNGTGDQLIEAHTPEELTQRLSAIQVRTCSRPAVRPTSPAGRPGGPARGRRFPTASPGAAPVPIPPPRRGRHGMRRASWWRRLLGALIVMEEQ
jgi:hypothetical protein